MRWVWANADKPHRCPCCHAVCVRGMHHWLWTTGHCTNCQLRWLVRLGSYRWSTFERTRSHCSVARRHVVEQTMAVTLREVIGRLRERSDPLCTSTVGQNVINGVIADLEEHYELILHPERGDN